MSAHRGLRLDDTLPLAFEGYAWLPNRWRRAHADADYRFAPERFLGREIDPYELLPQGGGDPAAGHRCPGEAITVALLRALAVKLAHLDHTLPDQDLTIPLRRIPTRPRSGLLVEVRRPTG